MPTQKTVTRSEVVELVATADAESVVAELCVRLGIREIDVRQVAA